MSDSITEAFREHHERVFAEHGATARGVDWASDEDVVLRYEKMVALFKEDFAKGGRPVTVLDVGCGYGGLLDFSKTQGMAIQYTGIDVVQAMIEHAARQHPAATFIHGDIFEHKFDGKFDYVVCSGILTQKLGAGRRAMLRFAQKLVRRMYALCNAGVAFNMMSTNVNYMAPNLFYVSPVEMLAFCLDEVTSRVRLDHAYRLFYEFTLYLYRETTCEVYAP